MRAALLLLFLLPLAACAGQSWTESGFGSGLSRSERVRMDTEAIMAGMRRANPAGPVLSRP